MTPGSLNRGANQLFSRLLYYEDGVTPLPVNVLDAAIVELSQEGTVIDTFTLGTDNELRAGSAINELILELTSTFTTPLTAGKVLVAKWTLKLPDAEFVVEPNDFIDVQPENLVIIL